MPPEPDTPSHIGNNVPVTSQQISIGDDHVNMTIAPDAGGRIAQITHDGFDLLVPYGRNTAAPTAWGCYPMVPWAGRIRRGRFTFDDQPLQLVRNFEGHAIHGVGFEMAWIVTVHQATVTELTLDLPSDEHWPFGGSARQRFEVSGNRIRMELSVTAGDRRMPATIGWHPWFVKPESVVFTPTAMYLRDDDGIPTGELIDVRPGPLDDCFLNTQPVIVEIAGRRLRLTSNCDHWVVYDQPAHATCIEPQTGPPDSFTIAPHVLDSGDTLAAWYEIEIARPND